MGKEDRTQLIINTQISLLDLLLPGVPVWKIYSTFRLGRIEKNARRLEDKINNDRDYFEERLNKLDKDLEEELKEKIAYILCEYLLESIDKVKLEEYYVYFKMLFENPKVDITELRRYMEMITELTHKDIDTMIHLKRNLDYTRKYNRPFVERKQYFNLQSYYSNVNNRSKGVLLKYGLIEENYDELSKFIHEVRRKDVDPFQKTFEIKYKLSSLGEGFLHTFEHLHEEIEQRAKQK